MEDAKTPPPPKPRLSATRRSSIRRETPPLLPVAWENNYAAQFLDADPNIDIEPSPIRLGPSHTPLCHEKELDDDNKDSPSPTTSPERNTPEYTLPKRDLTPIRLHREKVSEEQLYEGLLKRIPEAHLHDRGDIETKKGLSEPKGGVSEEMRLEWDPVAAEKMFVKPFVGLGLGDEGRRAPSPLKMMRSDRLHSTETVIGPSLFGFAADATSKLKEDKKVGTGAVPQVYGGSGRKFYPDLFGGTYLPTETRRGSQILPSAQPSRGRDVYTWHPWDTIPHTPVAAHYPRISSGRENPSYWDRRPAITISSWKEVGKDQISPRNSGLFGTIAPGQQPLPGLGQDPRSNPYREALGGMPSPDDPVGTRSGARAPAPRPSNCMPQQRDLTHNFRRLTLDSSDHVASQDSGLKISKHRPPVPNPKTSAFAESRDKTAHRKQASLDNGRTRLPPLPGNSTDFPRFPPSADQYIPSFGPPLDGVLGPGPDPRKTLRGEEKWPASEGTRRWPFPHGPYPTDTSSDSLFYPMKYGRPKPSLANEPSGKVGMNQLKVYPRGTPRPKGKAETDRASRDVEARQAQADWTRFRKSYLENPAATLKGRDLPASETAPPSSKNVVPLAAGLVRPAVAPLPPSTPEAQQTPLTYLASLADQPLIQRSAHPDPRTLEIRNSFKMQVQQRQQKAAEEARKERNSGIERWRDDVNRREVRDPDQVDGEDVGGVHEVGGEVVVGEDFSGEGVNLEGWGGLDSEDEGWARGS